MKKDPDNSGYYSKLGFTVFSLGKAEEAKVTFTKAVALDPKSVVGHYNLGMILFHVFEEREEGVQHLKQVLNLQPSGSYADEARRLIENDRK